MQNTIKTIIIIKAIDIDTIINIFDVVLNLLLSSSSSSYSEYIGGKTF